jgi:very-short-patch-repair endonuclease
MYRNAEQRDFARKLRNVMTPAERVLWRLLRADQLQGFRFRRQASIGPYTVDFVCFAKKLIVELDGPQHAEAIVAAHDTERTEWLLGQGFRVLRFWNHQLDDGAQPVADAILRALHDRDPGCDASPLPNPLHQGEGAGGSQ